MLYQYNVLGTRGPRKMTALIPKVNNRGQRHLFREGATTEEVPGGDDALDAAAILLCEM